MTKLHSHVALFVVVHSFVHASAHVVLHDTLHIIIKDAVVASASAITGTMVFLSVQEAIQQKGDTRRRRSQPHLRDTREKIV